MLKEKTQSLVPPFKEKCFHDHELGYLNDMYHLLYPTMNIVKLSRFYKEYKKVTINREEYTSSQSRSQRSNVIAAKWPSVLGIDAVGDAPVRIGQVVSFINHDIVVSSETSTASCTSKSHILVRVQWYGDHPRRDYIHSSVILCSTVFDNESSACFIPISRVMCRCVISSPVSLTFDYGTDRVFVAVPILKNTELD